MTHDSHDSHESVERLLNKLADVDRREPDAAFEDRLAGVVNGESAGSARPHRHRRAKRSTAWIPLATAAAVGAFAFFWWPASPMPVREVSEPIAGMAGSDGAESAPLELWIDSFEVVDQMLALEGTLSTELDLIDAQLESTRSCLVTDTDWADLGDAL